MRCTVRNLTSQYGSSDNKESDLLDVTVDAATVTDTVIALAEMQSKRSHRFVVMIVVLIAALVGFSQQITHVVGTVR